jgi:hypothetical protein
MDYVLISIYDNLIVDGKYLILLLHLLKLSSYENKRPYI